MRIGEVAERVRIAPSAIRFYEDAGLIPAPERTESGYRKYGPEVVDRLEFIRAGQAIGLSLRELGEVLGIRDRGDSPCRHVTDLLGTRIEEIDARIRELEAMRRDLNDLQERAVGFDPADCPPESVCRILQGDP